MSMHNLQVKLEQAWMKSTGRIFRTPEGRMNGWGSTVGNGVQGWAPGAKFIDSGDGIEWRNEGSSTVAIWVPVGPRSLVTEFVDDFYEAPLDANFNWVEVDDGTTGTNAILDAANGVGSIVTAAVDNDYHAIRTPGQGWLFAAGKVVWFEARFKVAEANTNESAWWFGFTDTLTTGGFQANAAGPLASYDGALIWKDEATMAIDFETSNAATQDTTTAMATFVTDTWTKVGFLVDGTATTSVVTPYYNVDDSAGWTAGTAGNITLSGLAEMHIVAGIKAGPTGGAETLQVDYIRAIQVR